jgi:hypothetical protein
MTVEFSHHSRGRQDLGSSPCWTGTGRAFDPSDWPTGASADYDNVVDRVPGSGPPAVVKPEPTSAYGKPVLDERTFQQLMAAAYMLQEHNDCVLMKEPNADCAALSPRGIVQNFRPIQVVSHTPERGAVPQSTRPAGSVLRLAQSEVESLASLYDSIIPPETAYRLSVLASQLEALMRREIRSNSEWTTPSRPE